MLLSVVFSILTENVTKIWRMKENITIKKLWQNNMISWKNVYSTPEISQKSKNRCFSFRNTHKHVFRWWIIKYLVSAHTLDYFGGRWSKSAWYKISAYIWIFIYFLKVNCKAAKMNQNPLRIALSDDET